MTEQDLKLLAEARNLAPIQWYRAFELEEQAESQEAKVELRRIGVALHCREEFLAGTL